jgi:hypothetical protein
MKQIDLNKTRYWFRSVGILILAFFCIGSVLVVLSKNIIYIFPNNIYPKSQTVSKISSTGFGIGNAIAVTHSTATFKTVDNINQVYDWYLKHGWQESYKDQDFGRLSENVDIPLLLNYHLTKWNTIEIRQSGYQTKIDVWIGIYLFH